MAAASLEIPIRTSRLAVAAADSSGTSRTQTLVATLVGAYSATAAGTLAGACLATAIISRATPSEGTQVGACSAITPISSRTTLRVVVSLGAVTSRITSRAVGCLEAAIRMSTPGGSLGITKIKEQLEELE